MSRLFYLLCLCLAISISVSVSVSACPNPSPSYQPTADAIHIYAPSQNNAALVEQDITIGHEVVIALPSNPSTGYSWNWMNEPALPSLSYLGCSYNATTSGGPPGSGGTEYWGFRASSVGTTSLPLSYRRPWSTSAAADEKHVTIQLRVMSNGSSDDNTNVNPNGRGNIYNNGYTLLPSTILILSLVFLSLCL